MTRIATVATMLHAVTADVPRVGSENVAIDAAVPVTASATQTSANTETRAPIAAKIAHTRAARRDRRRLARASSTRSPVLGQRTRSERRWRYRLFDRRAGTGVDNQRRQVARTISAADAKPTRNTIPTIQSTMSGRYPTT